MAGAPYCRDHRPDCKQACIALFVTRNGLPLGHEVFEDQRTDVTTVEEIVIAMAERNRSNSGVLDGPIDRVPQGSAAKRSFQTRGIRLATSLTGW